MSNNSQDLIGKIFKSRFKYFDSKLSKVRFKVRPVLIIGVEREKTPCDLTVLPISKVSMKVNLNEDYDYEITKSEHGNLSLDQDPSYIRTHKVTTIHSQDLPHNGMISSLKDSYPEDYKLIKDKFEKFSQGLFNTD